MNPPLSFDIGALNHELERASPQDILRRALALFGDGLVIASSFSVEDTALIDMAVALEPRVKVFTLDTGRLPEETYHVIDRVRARYRVEVVSYFPDTSAVERLVTLKGPSSFYDSVDNRKECCRIRKVEPLRRALAGKRAWATGLRREQSVTRKDLKPFELDEASGGLVKVSPLAAWSHDELWAYVKERNVPYNKLHDQGYPSIGCAPCTRAVGPDDDVRAGRWWWESPDSKECGLHAKESERHG